MNAHLKKKLYEISYIFFKNVVLLTNGVILAVVVLLFIFGDGQSGFFIGLILFLNMALGILQDLRAWYALDKLQSLTAPKVTRIKPDGAEESVLAEQISKGDRVKLKNGDQVPCDGKLIEARNFEVNQGLITGESDLLAKSKGDRVLAGSVVTTGYGLMESETVFSESRIARMTAGIKAYSVSASPIQKAVQRIILYTVYLSVAAIVFVVVRGNLTHEPILRMIKVVGAVTSMFVPQGLVFAVTLFFAYGAARLFQRRVLLQEVNATEKLGRIKNLCMDKTGTLTKNELVVEGALSPQGVTKERAAQLIAAYVAGNDDSSEIVQAIKKYFKQGFGGEIVETLEFSSWRRFGAVRVIDNKEELVIFAGLPDHLMARIVSEPERQWLRVIVDSHTHLGKRVLCFAQAKQSGFPKDLSSVDLSLLAVVVLYSALREGIRDTIDFFQARGVRIRIISGDNVQTTRAIAAAAGIQNTEKFITGKEIASWSDTDLAAKVESFAVFAEIVPEQKEKIIDAFKKTGFTAMVGDGANDALAIKKADLGIAMFDGAAATRRIASVVLTNNSFAALPGGVALADDIIRNIEIFGSIFFNSTFTGILLFIVFAALGVQYPFTPLNITLTNYFTVGIPGLLLSYWTIWPQGKIRAAKSQSFLKTVLPFTGATAAVQALGAAAVFFLSPLSLRTAESNTPLILSFTIFGFLFFTLAPGVYRGALSRTKKIQLWVWAAAESLLLVGVFHVPLLMTFFNITPLNLPIILICQMALVVVVAGYVQYRLAKRFIQHLPDGPMTELSET